MWRSMKRIYLLFLFKADKQTFITKLIGRKSKRQIPFLLRRPFWIE